MAGERAVVFLDRDGTVIEDLGYPREPERISLLPGAAEALRAFARAGLALVVVSNQSGIARGLVTGAEAQAVHERFVELLADEGVALDGAYYCPHGPDDGCECRKPAPGLLLAGRRRARPRPGGLGDGRRQAGGRRGRPARRLPDGVARHARSGRLRGVVVARCGRGGARPDPGRGVNGELVRLVDRFPGVRVLAIGDVMLDEYVWGAVSRISPEAPVPVVEIERRSEVPGRRGERRRRRRRARRAQLARRRRRRRRGGRTAPQAARRGWRRPRRPRGRCRPADDHEAPRDRAQPAGRPRRRGAARSHLGRRGGGAARMGARRGRGLPCRDRLRLLEGRRVRPGRRSCDRSRVGRRRTGRHRSEGCGVREVRAARPSSRRTSPRPRVAQASIETTPATWRASPNGCSRR